MKIIFSYAFHITKTLFRAIQHISIIVFILVAVFCLYLSCVAFYNYGYREMDWDSDGVTSFHEIFSGADIGKRERKINNTSCVEYYSYKDGTPVKLDCNKKINNNKN